jgi:hypothetical protein
MECPRQGRRWEVSGSNEIDPESLLGKATKYLLPSSLLSQHRRPASGVSSSEALGQINGMM